MIDHLNLALFSNWHVIVIQPFSCDACVVFEIGVVVDDAEIGNTPSRQCILYAMLITWRLWIFVASNTAG